MSLTRVGKYACAVGRCLVLVVGYESQAMGPIPGTIASRERFTRTRDVSVSLRTHGNCWLTVWELIPSTPRHLFSITVNLRPLLKPALVGPLGMQNHILILSGFFIRLAYHVPLL